MAPAARADFAVEALAQLQKLQREMTQLAPRDKNYESNRRALEKFHREHAVREVGVRVGIEASGRHGGLSDFVQNCSSSCGLAMQLTADRLEVDSFNDCYF